MSYFLWVEDFISKDNNQISDSTKNTAQAVFGGILGESAFSENKPEGLKQEFKKHGVFIELTFQDGWRFIREDIAKIDYIILDIDLPAYADGEPDDHVIDILRKYYELSDTENSILLKNTCAELGKEAGFHLYTELVFEFGFPKENILFVSNHGNEQESIKTAFKKAKIIPPDIHTKGGDNSAFNHEVRDWIEKKYLSPYSRLRRGVIEACKYLRGLDKNNCRFDRFLSKTKGNSEDSWDPSEYLQTLENFLPLKEPDEPIKSTLYKLFIRLLAHEWDSAFPNSIDSLQEVYAFSSIMKMARNWSSHGNVFESAPAQQVAFLFIINMRAMFDLGNTILPYESYLLMLFNDLISETDFRNKNGTDWKQRKIPLLVNYANTIKLCRSSYKSSNFQDVLNEAQKYKKAVNSQLLRGIYQTFWFLTSTGYLDVNNAISQGKYLNYQFSYYDYTKKPYILEIARHIYKSSFLDD